MTKARIFLSYIFLSSGQLAERTIKAEKRNKVLPIYSDGCITSLMKSPFSIEYSIESVTPAPMITCLRAT